MTRIDLWPVAKVARLKELFAEGKTWREIGVVLHCSRNAALGKGHRLGLVSPKREPRSKPVRKRLSPTLQPRVRITPANTNSNAFRLSVTHQPAAIRELRTVDVVPRNIPFLELGNGECRYPQGEPVMFCGHPVDEGSSYCYAHRLLCSGKQF